MQSDRTQPPATDASMDDQRFLGPPSLLPGDNANDYEELRAAIVASMEPKDIIDLMWTRDITDLQWEVMRLRRIKVAVIRRHLRGAWKFSASALLIEDDEEISQEEDENPAVVSGPVGAKTERTDPLDNLDWEEDGELVAGVFSTHVSTMGQIERMIASAEGRRNAAFDHAERRRVNLGNRLRQAVEVAEKGQPATADNENDLQKRAA